VPGFVGLHLVNHADCGEAPQVKLQWRRCRLRGITGELTAGARSRPAVRDALHTVATVASRLGNRPVRLPFLPNQQV